MQSNGKSEVTLNSGTRSAMILNYEYRSAATINYSGSCVTTLDYCEPSVRLYKMLVIKGFKQDRYRCIVRERCRDDIKPPMPFTVAAARAANHFNAITFASPLLAFGPPIETNKKHKNRDLSKLLARKHSNESKLSTQKLRVVLNLSACNYRIVSKLFTRKQRVVSKISLWKSRMTSIYKCISPKRAVPIKMRWLGRSSPNLHSQTGTLVKRHAWPVQKAIAGFARHQNPMYRTHFLSLRTSTPANSTRQQGRFTVLIMIDDLVPDMAYDCDVEKLFSLFDATVVRKNYKLPNKSTSWPTSALTAMTTMS